MALKNFLEDLAAKNEVDQKQRDENAQKEKERREKVQELVVKIVNEVVEPTVAAAIPLLEKAGFVVTRKGELKEFKIIAVPLIIKKSNNITQLDFSFNDRGLNVIRNYSNSMSNTVKGDEFAALLFKEITPEKIEEIIEKAVKSMLNNFR